LLTPLRHLVRFPAWHLGRHSEQHFISASASFALAEDFGRDVRNLMKSEEYHQVFDTTLAGVGARMKAAAISLRVLARRSWAEVFTSFLSMIPSARWPTRSEPARKNVHDWFSANTAGWKKRQADSHQSLHASGRPSAAVCWLSKQQAVTEATPPSARVPCSRRGKE
jgi:hypothetical protein